MALRVYAFAVQALFFKLLKFIQRMIDQYWFQSFFFYIVWFSIFSRGNIFFLVSINLFLFLGLLFWSNCEKSQFQQSLKSVIVTTATGSFENKRAGNSEVALHVFRIFKSAGYCFVVCGGGGGEWGFLVYEPM